MWKGLVDFCRDKILGTVLVTLITGGLGGWALSWQILEARVNRVEELKVDTVKDLNKERQDMLVRIQSFTSSLINDGKLNPNERDAIAASLSKQYSGYGGYSFNLNQTDLVEIKNLQSSMNQFRKSLLSVQTKDDLDPFYLALRDLFIAYKKVDPLVDRSIKVDQAVSS